MVAVQIGGGNGAFDGLVQVGSDSEPNTIAGYTQAGVLVAFNAGTGNQVAANHFRNGLGGGQTALDLSAVNQADGPTANDPLDADSGPNGLLNKPELLVAERASAGAPVAVSGQYSGLPNSRFRLRFYASDAGGGSGFGPGQRLLPETLQIDTDASGQASFGPILVSADATANVITATATLRSGLLELESSEFSNARPIVLGNQPVIAVVTTNAANGAGSLRAAIEAANAGSAGVLHEIRFNLPAAQRTISVATPLPDLVRSVLIDGWSQPGSVPNSEAAGLLSNALIGVTLSNDLAIGPTLQLAGGQSIVRGLAIVGNGSGQGLEISANGVSVLGCWFGQRASGTLDPLGSTAIVTQGEGIRIGGPEPAARNVFAATPLGLDHFGEDLLVQNNLFGLRANGSQPPGGQPRAIDASGSGQIRDNVFGGYPAVGPDAGAMRLQGFNGELLDNAIGESADGAQAFDLGVGLLLVDSQLLSVSASSRRIANATDAAIVLAQDQTGSGQITLRQAIVASARGVRVQGSGHANIDFEATAQTSDGIAFDLVAAGDPAHGATPNDPGDGDSGPNGLQNTPELLAVLPDGAGIRVSGLLDSLPDTDFELLLCGLSAATAHGFGGCEQILLRGQPLRTDGGGQAVFELSVDPLPPGVAFLSAGVARLDPGGVRESSELSALLPIAPPADPIFADGYE